jgi:hypothetical protein
MLDKIIYLENGDKKYPLAFSLNVMESIQNEYGSLDAWSNLAQNSKEPNIKVLKFFITEAINEGLEIENSDSEPISTKQVGRILTEVGLLNAAKKIRSLISDSIPKSDEPPKNVKTTRSKK